jgi:hypothetical protein
MIQFLLNHPALFLFLLPAIPSVLGKLEKAAIARLLSAGDAADQKLIRTVTKGVVVWAEDKSALDGSGKFAIADKLVARAMPFLSADQRKALIQNAVAELDKDANDALAEAPAQKSPPAA